MFHAERCLLVFIQLIFSAINPLFTNQRLASCIGNVHEIGSTLMGITDTLEVHI